MDPIRCLGKSTSIKDWRSLEFAGLFLLRAFTVHVANGEVHREALTPSKDFIISPHSECDGLYVATCGSFHGFKFLPILGKYVVEMLDGNLEPALKERWAWDRKLPPTEKNTHWPWKELKDLFNES
jgi:glycine/D-amino acid oxidase-like deaminating enzyme